MDLQKIKEIIDDKIPLKEERVLEVIAQDENSAIHLIKVINYDRQVKTEALSKMNVQLCHAHFYIADYVKPEKKIKPGLTRAFLLQQIKEFYHKHKEVVFHHYSGTAWAKEYLENNNNEE